MEGLIAIDHGAPWGRFASWPGAKLVHAVHPGLLVAGAIALASRWLAQHYAAQVMVFALLFGMAFHLLDEEGRCVAGIEFASRSVLRLGVGLLGVRNTLGQIASLGGSGRSGRSSSASRRQSCSDSSYRAASACRRCLASFRPARSRSAALRPRWPSPPSCRPIKTASATPS